MRIRSFLRLTGVAKLQLASHMKLFDLESVAPGNRLVKLIFTSQLI